MEIRGRLKDLNTKAYYLLVALSFLYRTGPALSLKLALCLAALVAVLPVQGYVESQRGLAVVRVSKIVCLVLALACTLWWVWCVRPHPATFGA